MSERPEPTLDQIALQWFCLWQMGLRLLAFTPGALAREAMAQHWRTTPRRK